MVILSFSEKSDNSAAYESSLNWTIEFEREVHNVVAANTRQCHLSWS